jgi:hypothetical protein
MRTINPTQGLLPSPNPVHEVIFVYFHNQERFIIENPELCFLLTLNSSISDPRIRVNRLFSPLQEIHLSRFKELLNGSHVAQPDHVTELRKRLTWSLGRFGLVSGFIFVPPPLGRL